MFPATYGYRNAKSVLLEDALEPFQSRIDQLMSYVTTAKERRHFPSEHDLTHDESASIYIYTMEWEETTLDKLSSVRGVVSCGVSNDTGKNWSRNQKITWSSISSCSSSINVIRDFLQNATKSTTFLIEISCGKRICGYTDHEHENDVILKMETSFRVQDDVLEHPKRSYHVHLVETDDLQIRIDLKDKTTLQSHSK
ncbi:unnamed protein product [Adineta ricciae]|uniref:Uncharacterized protein n=1 Tax=Adineta ricciae TaxID=249248 RepID=A0A814WYW2_ADIRI|nr:unnamed protein product [Adineta ricciae]CAF1208930.1 unnamed protein product [Adineta ricciae]